MVQLSHSLIRYDSREFGVGAGAMALDDGKTAAQKAGQERGNG